MPGSLSEGRLAARRRAVAAHMEAERRRDMAAVLATYGRSTRLEFVGPGLRFDGAEHVGATYAELFRAFPDLELDILAEHVGDDAIVLEVALTGTQRAAWMGLPAHGRRLKTGFCAIFEFDEEDRIACERVYFDRADVVAQLAGSG